MGVSYSDDEDDYSTNNDNNNNKSAASLTAPRRHLPIYPSRGLLFRRVAGWSRGVHFEGCRLLDKRSEPQNASTSYYAFDTSLCTSLLYEANLSSINLFHRVVLGIEEHDHVLFPPEGFEGDLRAVLVVHREGGGFGADLCTTTNSSNNRAPRESKIGHACQKAATTNTVSRVLPRPKNKHQHGFTAMPTSLYSIARMQNFERSSCCGVPPFISWVDSPDMYTTSPKLFFFLCSLHKIVAKTAK